MVSSLISPETLLALGDESTRTPFGAIAEVGVYKGGSDDLD